jgi:Dam-replacing family
MLKSSHSRRFALAGCSLHFAERLDFRLRLTTARHNGAFTTAFLLNAKTQSRKGWHGATRELRQDQQDGSGFLAAMQLGSIAERVSTLSLISHSKGVRDRQDACPALPVVRVSASMRFLILAWLFAICPQQGADLREKLGSTTSPSSVRSSFAFPSSAIVKRKPLSQSARRAGWVGCNFALDRIPLEARIGVIRESQIVSENAVREHFRRVKPLKDDSIKERGWTLGRR